MLTPCPCRSGKSYKNCCKIFHEGAAFPKNALQLMRSRYSAYVKGNVNYIIKTTHPDHPNHLMEPNKWREDILFFCQNTKFKGLKILEFEDKEPISTVTFLAQLERNGKDASFIEKSLFEKVNGPWLYKSGTLFRPK